MSNNEQLIYVKPSDLKLYPTDTTSPLHKLKDSPRLKSLDDDTLKLSIEKFGVLLPLLVLRDGKEGIVFSGRRRYANALRIENEGTEIQVPIIVKKFDPTDALLVQMIENNLRQANSPLTTAFEVTAALEEPLLFSSAR